MRVEDLHPGAPSGAAGRRGHRSRPRRPSRSGARLRDDIARGERTGPRILAVGPPLTPPGGHCWFLGGEVAGVDEIRAQIHYLADLGVDLIKIMVPGGHITPDSCEPWEEQFTPDGLRSVVDISSELGLPVAAHAHGAGAIATAPPGRRTGGPRGEPGGGVGPAWR